MREDVIGVVVTLAVIAAIVPLIVVQGAFRLQELHEAWRKLAYRHGLHFDPGPRLVLKATVSGSINGRTFLLQRAGGNNNKAPVYMELGLRHEPGADVSRMRLLAEEQLTEIGGEVDGKKLKVMVGATDDLEHLDKVLRTLVAVAPVLEAA